MLGGAFFQSRAGPFEVRAVSGVIPALVIADDRGNIRRMLELVINDLGDQLMSLGCGEGGAFFRIGAVGV